MRHWTDNTGRYTTVGRLIVVMDTKVRIRKDNGRFTTVPKRRLSQADLEYVERVADGFGYGVIDRIAGR